MSYNHDFYRQYFYNIGQPGSEEPKYTTVAIPIA